MEDRDSTDLDLARTRPKEILSSPSAFAVNARRQLTHHAGRGPIFVNSSFRTSSTWFWQKLRSTPHVMAYYEIFHEALASLGKRDASALSASSWTSSHPHSAPYFLEYLPLLKEGGGLSAFDASMAYDKFIPAGGLEGQLSLEETLHIDSLLRAAQNNGKLPVLTCTRTLGRASAISKAYGGTSILLTRNLFHQWASYSGQAATGNPYFLNSIDRTIKSSKHDPFIRSIDEWFEPRQNLPHDKNLFILFLVFHIHLYSKAYECADLVVDSTKLSNNSEYRSHIEGRISSIIDYDIDLSDAEQVFDASFVDVGCHKEFIDTIDQFVKIIKGNCLSEMSVDFIDTMKNDAIQEWDRHEFYTGRARAVHRAEVRHIREEQTAISDQLSRQSDAWDSERVSLEVANGEIAAEVARITLEWENLNREFAATAADRDNLQAQLSECSKNLDSARGSLEESATLQQSIASALADRDGLAAQISDQTATWADQRSALESALEAALAEGVRLTQEKDSLLGLVEQLKSERDSMTELQERGLLHSVWAKLDEALRHGKT